MIAGGVVSFPSSELRHLRKVLRLEDGDLVQVFDGSGREYTVRLAGDQGMIEQVNENNTDSVVELTLVQGIAKGEKMDFIIQKAVELGVHRIIPLTSERVVVDLRGKEEARQTRWQKIAQEACKQCQRSIIPSVERVMTFPQAISARGETPGVFCYEAVRSSGQGIGHLIKDKREAFNQGVYLYVGPEGGFSADEARRAHEAGLYLAGLGPRILRTETASLAALAILQYELGDLGG
jgi:16S rRNA (uracil1498-N3)-methyltransferase